MPLQMLAGPLVRFNLPRETRTFCAFGALTRNIARLSGKMHGYLASATFNGFGLQSAGACPQDKPQPKSAGTTKISLHAAIARSQL